MALSVARPVLTSSSTPISQHAVELTTSLAKKCELASTLCTHAHVGCCFRCLPTGMETITDYMLAMFVLFMFHLSCNGPNTPSPPPPPSPRGTFARAIQGPRVPVLLRTLQSLVRSGQLGYQSFGTHAQSKGFGFTSRLYRLFLKSSLPLDCYRRFDNLQVGNPEAALAQYRNKPSRT